MKPRERPPIPPLPEAAVGRIERRVFAALDSTELQAIPRARSRAFRLGAAAVVPLALVIAALVVRGLRQDAEVLPHGTRIATAGTSSHVTIRGAAVDVAPRSAVTIGGESDGTTLVTLERGAVTCRVSPRASGAPFVVLAGVTRVTVVGTRFTVTRQGDHAAVSVEQGVVEVGDDGVSRILRAGERYQPSEGPPAEPRGARGRADDGGPPGAPVAAATPGAAGNPRPARAASRARTQLAPPASPRVANVGATASTPTDPGPATPSSSAPAAVSTEDVETPAAPAAAAAPAPDAAVVDPLPSPSPQQLFETAVRLEVTAPAESLRLYQELARGTDAWAANALFAGARLQAERGHRDEARAWLDTYLQRFPDGNNAADARVLLRRLR